MAPEVNHKAKHCRSNYTFYKTVLDVSSGRYLVKIIVQPTFDLQSALQNYNDLNLSN